MHLRIFLLIAIIIVLPLQGFAQDEPDLKAQFLSAWEEYQRNLPTTVNLKKTEESTIYEYETTLFPYKGKLRVNNILISRDLNYYYDYNLGIEQVIKGFAEVELLDLSSEDLFGKYPQSQQLWSKSHFLFWDDTKKSWLSAEQWKETQYLADIPNDSYGYQKPCAISNVLGSIWPLLVIIVCLIVFITALSKKQKQYAEKYDLSLNRQLESLEIQKQSLEHQKEIIKLLEQKR